MGYDSYSIPTFSSLEYLDYLEGTSRVRGIMGSPCAGASLFHTHGSPLTRVSSIFSKFDSSALNEYRAQYPISLTPQAVRRIRWRACRRLLENIESSMEAMRAELRGVILSLRDNQYWMLAGAPQTWPTSRRGSRVSEAHVTT